MLEYLLEPFSYEYMQKAMWISTAVGGICAFLSAYLMLKGWSLIGDALSHSVVPGVAIAYAFSLPYALGAFFAGILAALSILWIKSISKLKEDAVIGFIFSTFFALGLLIISLNPTSINVQNIILKELENAAIYDGKIREIFMESRILEILYRSFHKFNEPKNALSLDENRIKTVQKAKKIQPWVKQLLRISIYQMVFLDKIPDRAAIFEAVQINDCSNTRFEI